VKLTRDHIEILSQGIATNTSLKEIFINNCELTSKELEALAPGLSQSQSLVVIDFSNNSLGDKTGMLIGKILSNHC